MDITRYKFYVRDVGVSDDDLSNILQDVINDIALDTRIFKKAFGFTIEPDLYDYNFRGLLQVYEMYQQRTINDLIINSYTEDQLLQYLSDPTQLDITVTEDADSGIPHNTYIETIDVLTKIDDADYSPLGSVFNLFEPIDGDSFKYVGYTTEPINAVCVINIIPNIENIDDRMELLLRPAIIEGLKYYTDTALNPQNVNPDVNSYKKFVNAKLSLQNKFPVYVTQQIKRSPL